MKKACAPLPSKPSIVWSIAPCGKRKSYGNISSAIIINEKSNAQELHTTELKNVNPSMIGQNTSITAQHSAFGRVILSSVKGAAPCPLSMREKTDMLYDTIGQQICR